MANFGASLIERSHTGSTRITRGQPTPVLNHVHYSTSSSMGLCVSITSCRQSTTRGIDQGAISGEAESQQQRYASFSCYASLPLSKHGPLPLDNSIRTTSIHILDDDSLLHVFHLYRPFLSGEDEDDNARLWGGWRDWARGRWWYKLAQVCRRWRNIIFRSAFYLELSLVCTYGTPVADMLAHSPLFPLVIDYFEEGREVTTDDEEGAILALKQRHRVRRVRFELPVTTQQKFIAAMDEEYPILEYLVIGLPMRDLSTISVFSETLQAPHLRHLRLSGFTLPIGSRLFTSAVGLVTLSLVMVQPSTYFHPNFLLQWTSLMPQLETLTIYFNYSVSNHDLERQLADTPIVAPVTLPNLRYFVFHGVSAYLETLVHRVTMPRLEKLKIEFFNQLMFFVPRLLQLMNQAKNLRFHSAILDFLDDKVVAGVYPHGDNWEVEKYAFDIRVFCWDLNRQVSSMTQIFDSDSHNQMFSAVEHLTLDHEVHSQSSEEHNQVDRTEWRKLLRPFRNVKTLRIDDRLVKDISRCLQSDDGELPLELLPELQELTYSGGGDTGDGFTSFIDARQNAGHPVALVRV